MALSVLQIAMNAGHVLYDSNLKKAILSGTKDEMYEWKDSIERAQQKKENQEYMAQLKNERIKLLMAGGHSEQEATDFLKKAMPQLFN